MESIYEQVSGKDEKRLLGCMSVKKITDSKFKDPVWLEGYLEDKGFSFLYSLSYEVWEMANPKTMEIVAFNDGGVFAIKADDMEAFKKYLDMVRNWGKECRSIIPGQVEEFCILHNITLSWEENDVNSPPRAFSEGQEVYMGAAPCI